MSYLKSCVYAVVLLMVASSAYAQSAATISMMETILAKANFSTHRALAEAQGYTFVQDDTEFKLFEYLGKDKSELYFYYEDGKITKLSYVGTEASYYKALASLNGKPEYVRKSEKDNTSGTGTTTYYEKGPYSFGANSQHFKITMATDDPPAQTASIASRSVFTVADIVGMKMGMTTTNYDQVAKRYGFSLFENDTKNELYDYRRDDGVKMYVYYDDKEINTISMLWTKEEFDAQVAAAKSITSMQFSSTQENSSGTGTTTYYNRGSYKISFNTQFNKISIYDAAPSGTSTTVATTPAPTASTNTAVSSLASASQVARELNNNLYEAHVNFGTQQVDFDNAGVMNLDESSVKVIVKNNKLFMALNLVGVSGCPKTYREVPLMWTGKQGTNGDYRFTMQMDFDFACGEKTTKEVCMHISHTKLDPAALSAYFKDNGYKKP